MIHIDFKEPDDLDWQEWRLDCQREQAAHNDRVEGRQEAKVKAELYKRMKKTHFTDRQSAFRGKCAFCESEIRTAQHGDVEHFRPKGAITNRDGSGVLLSTGEDHPGYYWLAYAWENLLPSCVLCNQPSTEPNGVSLGKRNYFPLADETTRAEAPGDEAAEGPLLIHPVIDEPDKYLGIDKTGVMYAIDGSPRGQTCIDIFGLNDRELPAARKRVYDDVKTIYLKYLVRAIEDRESPGLAAEKARVQSIMAGGEEYTLAARTAIAEVDQLLGALIEHTV
jgi:hypothetical protein